MPEPPREKDFSVVIPVRNGGKYISAAVESILKQTYQRFNIIVLENCSTDDTVSLIAAFGDPRISIFPAPAPLSIEDNWQRILDLDLAEYLTILSHDDLLYPDFLQEIADLIDANPQASLYGAHFHLIDERGNVIRPCQPMPYEETAESFLRARHRFKRDTFGTGYVARSADYKKVGGLPPFPMLLYADDIAWYRLANLSSKVCSPKYLFAYRRHPQSASQLVDLLSLYQASKQYLAFLSQSDYFTSPANAALGHHLVKVTFHGRHHLLLAELIASGDAGMLQEYKKAKAQLLAKASADSLFQVYDPISRVLELLAFAPAPRVLKKFLLRLTEAIGNLTRSLRQKGPAL